MSREPLISVVIPTFNRAKLVARAIESVLHQTFHDYEIIVVDDAGTDSTEESLKKKFGKQIIYIKQERNRGLPAARNAGIKVAQGAYLAFLDDDDEWLPEKLALQMQRIQGNTCLGLIYCGYSQVDENGNFIKLVIPAKEPRIAEKLLYWNCITCPPSGVLVKKEVLHTAGYFDEKLSACEDWDMWIRCAQCTSFDFIDVPLVRYMMHSSNMHKNLGLMEQNLFSVLNKYWPDTPNPQRNKAYSNCGIALAWQYYDAGSKKDFNRMIFKSLSHSPLNTVSLHGEQTGDTERALFEAYDAYWCSPGAVQEPSMKRKAYAQQYLQLAWEYYRQSDMKNFRRCVKRIFAHSFSWSTSRLVVPFLKSYLGKHFSDSVHAARTHIFK
jgi:glycosyltransferase involved in cell wall biosynthesis